MKRVKLVVAYDGTNYCGWQIQPNGTAIEEVLNRELSRLLKEEIQVIGASRTDSGVHAWGNIAVFDTSTRIPADKICIALNQSLPDDIVIQESCEVDKNWHPRKCNSRKTYEYRILNRHVPFPAERFNSYFYYYNLDIEKMREAAAWLIGEHDFKSFCSIRTQVEDTVRRIYSLNIEKHGERIDIRICGNGFLYNMVRIIVGSLIKVGCGFWEPNRIKEALEARDRSKAGPTAPAKGLTLVSIEEEQRWQDVIEEENEHWSYRIIQREIPIYGQSYLIIRACEERDYDRLLLRLLKQLERNGAKEVHVWDRTQRLHLGRSCDYFQFTESYAIWKMEKELFQEGSARALEITPEIYLKELLLEDVTTEQLALFCRIENETFAAVPNAASVCEEELHQEMQEGKKLYLIYSGQETAGILRLAFSQEDEREMEVEAIGVLERFRRKGIGRKSLLFAERIAREKNCGKIVLIAADNNRAIHLYEQMGYQKKVCFSNWYTAVCKKI